MQQQNMPKQESFNVSNYSKWKGEGSVTLQKMGANTVFLVKDQYDPDTGSPAPAKFMPVSEVSIQTLIEQNNATIAAIEADNVELAKLLTDTKNLLGGK